VTSPPAAVANPGMLATGWYARRLEHDVWPGVPASRKRRRSRAARGVRRALAPDRGQLSMTADHVRQLGAEGFTIGALAYPWGAARIDYTAETIDIAAGLGFTSAFTTTADFERPAEPPLDRSRFLMLATVPAAALAHRMAYSWPRQPRRGPCAQD
jgi:hypothetical protein